MQAGLFQGLGFGRCLSCRPCKAYFFVTSKLVLRLMLRIEVEWYLIMCAEEPFFILSDSFSLRF
jgi:hypothetical protein